MPNEHNVGDVEHWSMVVLYDRNTGEIIHTHECLSLRGGQHPDQKALEAEAMEHASLAGRDTAAASPLHVDPRSVKAGFHYKIDTKKQALVEIQQPTRKKSKQG